MSLNSYYILMFCISFFLCPEETMLCVSRSQTYFGTKNNKEKEGPKAKLAAEPTTPEANPSGPASGWGPPVGAFIIGSFIIGSLLYNKYKSSDADADNELLGVETGHNQGA